MISRNFKDLSEKTILDIELRDKNPKYDQYQQLLSSMVYYFFDRNATLIVDKSASKRTKEQKIILRTK